VFSCFLLLVLDTRSSSNNPSLGCITVQDYKQALAL
jgi:hypothetical protein